MVSATPKVKIIPGLVGLDPYQSTRDEDLDGVSERLVVTLNQGTFQPPLHLIPHHAPLEKSIPNIGNPNWGGKTLI